MNTVKAMNSMQEIMAVQQEKLQETREKFDGVGAGIRESLLEIDEIGRVLFGVNKDELKEADPCSMVAALAYDVNTGKRIIEKLNYIINRLR